MKLAQESLAHALAGAARALAEVEAGNALPRALSGVFASRPMSPAARGAIQDIAYRSLRRWGEARALLEKLADRPPSPPRLKALLCCALALASEDVLAYAPHTLVDQTVDACAADRELARARGMANAVLRRFLRERDTLLAAVMQGDEARWNYPSWWVDAVRSAWPDDWMAVLDAGNHQPPLTLRVNVRRTSVDAYLARLASLGIDAHRIGPVAVRLGRPRPVGEIPGFDDGDVSVQDAAAQLAAPLLAPEAGMRVLDACAAPGGKTGHLLELADVDLLALDQDGERLVRGWRWQPNCAPAMRGHATGGMAGPSTGSWPTCPARHRASCGGIRISAGCAGRPTAPGCRNCRPRFSTTCGRCSSPAGSCCW
jgi:16S rRNA (cytosine967-C5)-methyltransferase